MEVQTVFELAESYGVSLAIKDGRIIAKPAAAITDELRSTIRANKTAILALLSEQPPITIIRQACQDIIDPEIFRANLSPEDLGDIESGAISLPELQSFARMMRDRLTCERGDIPASYTATATCRHCGPIPIWAGSPSKVLGCPWCHLGGPPQ